MIIYNNGSSKHNLCQLFLAILNFIDLSSDSIALIRNYLHDRYQFVETSKRQSEQNLIERGIPQDAILAPLMFFFYISNISFCLGRCKCHQYADDNQRFFSCHPNN